MGKHRLASYYLQGCADKDAPICGSKCCEPSYDEYAKDGAAHSGSGDILRPDFTIDIDNDNDIDIDDDIRELIVIGAGKCFLRILIQYNHKKLKMFMHVYNLIMFAILTLRCVKNFNVCNVNKITNNRASFTRINAAIIITRARFSIR